MLRLDPWEKGEKMAEQKFEDVLNKLEGIVNDLEGGDLKLDEAIKKYEEGMKLSSLCNKKLDEIKKRIDVLVRDASGNLIEKKFDALSSDQDKPAKKDGSPGKKSRPKGEKYLF